MESAMAGGAPLWLVARFRAANGGAVAPRLPLLMVVALEQKWVLRAAYVSVIARAPPAGASQSRCRDAFLPELAQPLSLFNSRHYRAKFLSTLQTALCTIGQFHFTWYVLSFALLLANGR
jgi:hypothetical protein